MRRWVAIVLTLALMLTGLALPSGATASHWKRCGEAGYSGHVRARVVHCPYARHLIDRFIRESQSRGPHFTVRGFKCRGRTVGRHVGVKCRKGAHRRVRWFGTLSA